MFRSRRWLISVLVVALVTRLVFVALVDAPPLSDFAEYDRLAWSVANGQGYVDQVGQPTAFRPPGYPLFLAFVYRTVGHKLMAARAASAIMGTLTCLAIFGLANRTGNTGIATLAALIYALYPNAIYYTNLVATEVLFTFLFVTTILVAWELTLPRTPHRLTFWSIGVLFLGILTGLTALVRPIGLPLLVLFIAMDIFRLNSLKLTIWFGLLCLIGTLLPILPWTLRSYQISGRWVLLSTEGGVTMYIGNNPAAYMGGSPGEANEGLLPEDNPFIGLSEWEANEVGYQASLEFLRRQPAMAAPLVAFKMVNLFSPEWDGFFWNFHDTETFNSKAHSLSLVKQNPRLALPFILPIAASGLLIFFGFAGFFTPFGLQNRTFFTIVVIGWVVINSAFYTQARFHFPIVPILTIPAANLVKWLTAHRPRPDILGIRLLRQSSLTDYAFALYLGAIAVL